MSHVQSVSLVVLYVVVVWTLVANLDVPVILAQLVPLVVSLGLLIDRSEAVWLSGCSNHLGSVSGLSVLLCCFLNEVDDTDEWAEVLCIYVG